MKFIFVIIPLVLVACSSSSTRLTEEAKNLQVFETKPSECSVSGKVIGVSESGSREVALNDALNAAAELKATGIFIDEVVPNGRLIKVFSTAYSCN